MRPDGNSREPKRATGEGSRRSLACVLLMLSLSYAQSLAAQDSTSRAEVPLERCDRLPLVRVRVNAAPMRFLVDTAATSFLNLRSFPDGERKDIGVTSWAGATPAKSREVILKDFQFGNQTLHGVKLPAIDLRRIEKACGGLIDGVLGVDLLEKFGATIDLEKKVAVVGAHRNEHAAEALARKYVEGCLAAFNRADWDTYEGCVDPEVVWIMKERDIRGRGSLIEFLRSCEKGECPHPLPRVRLDRLWVAGEVAWFEYTYRIPGREAESRGMAIVRREQEGWLLMNVNNSEPSARAISPP
jgi:hypothetical protein